MLRGIPPTISPDLMYVLMSMGHGDEIVFADGNFPAASHGQRLVRADGLGVPDVLSGVAPFFPLDTYAEDRAVVMATVEDIPPPPIWQVFRDILTQSEGTAVTLTQLERFAFYERAKNAFAVVATAESAIYANLILKKGVVQPAAG